MAALGLGPAQNASLLRINTTNHAYDKPHLGSDNSSNGARHNKRTRVSVLDFEASRQYTPRSVFELVTPITHNSQHEIILHTHIHTHTLPASEQCPPPFSWRLWAPTLIWDSDVEAVKARIGCVKLLQRILDLHKAAAQTKHIATFNCKYNACPARCQFHSMKSTANANLAARTRNCRVFQSPTNRIRRPCFALRFQRAQQQRDVATCVWTGHRSAIHQLAGG